MELLEESQAVIVEHRGFSPRMDIGAEGEGGGITERKEGKKEILSKHQRPSSWSDFIRENLQRFSLF